MNYTQYDKEKVILQHYLDELQLKCDNFRNIDVMIHMYSETNDITNLNMIRAALLSRLHYIDHIILKKT